jgi:hypothetical protein
LSSYTGKIVDYTKEKGLRLLGLQTINPAETTEDTNKINVRALTISWFVWFQNNLTIPRVA